MWGTLLNGMPQTAPPSRTLVTTPDEYNTKTCLFSYFIIYIFVFSFVYLFICLFVFLFINLFIYLFVYILFMSVCLSEAPFVCLSVGLSV